MAARYIAKLAPRVCPRYFSTSEETMRIKLVAGLEATFAKVEDVSGSNIDRKKANRLKG